MKPSAGNLTFSCSRTVSGTRFLCCAALALGLGLATVKADTIYEAAPAYGGTVSLPRFDPSYGQLTDVSLSLNGTVGLTYTYEPVPEPSALALLAGGLVLLVRRSRRLAATRGALSGRVVRRWWLRG